VIAGGPLTGKTYLSRSFQHTPVYHTDDLIRLGDMAKQVEAAVDRLQCPGSWVLEGVTTVRALRHWMRAHPGAKPPLDRVLYLRRPMADRTPQQTAMAKGIETVWHEIEPQLRALGVEVTLP
jgi:dephospho-CoA kinase